MRSNARYLKVFKNREEYESKKYEIMGIPHLVLFEDINKTLPNDGKDFPNFHVHQDNVRIFRNCQLQGDKVIIGNNSTINNEKLILTNE